MLANFFKHTQYKTFAHGIHSDDHKSETNTLSIKQFPFAPLMLIPLNQHIGKPAIPVVRAGQEVNRGELLARADGWVSAPIHSPVTGKIKKIDLMPHISGDLVNGIFLETAPGSTQESLEALPCYPDESPDSILAAIQNAGIVGLGGAAFPTHVKLKAPTGKQADTLVINGVECEPYLTTDHRVMLEQTDDIYMGVRYLLKITNAKNAIIGIEANKTDAADKLLQNKPQDLALDIVLLEVKYPQGAEKMLIKALLNREVAADKHSIDEGVIGVNIATVAEIGRLLPAGRGIQERVITIGGPAISNKGNYRIPIGTPLDFILHTVRFAINIKQVFFGGPMMGPAAADWSVPLMKGTSGIIAFTGSNHESREKTLPCIHCGACVNHCPMSLNPSMLGLLAKNKEYSSMVNEYYLKDCFECGVCSYVCPSHIPLVQYFRLAKSFIRKQASKQ